MFSVSICIATLGRESLRASAEFALAALEPESELLIVDDRPEPTGPLPLPDDARIRIVRGRAMGWTGPARNTGLQEARSDWVIFCDDDDFLHPYVCKWLRETLEEAPKADVVVWRAQGTFQHLPHDYPIPPRDSTSLRLGLVTNSLCVRVASGLRYGETVLPHWIKPGFEQAVKHSSRDTMSPNEDFLFMQEAQKKGTLVFSRYLAYGYGLPPPPHSDRFPVVIL